VPLVVDVKQSAGDLKLFAVRVAVRTRYAQSLQGLPTTFSRAPMPEASPAQQAAIRKALVGLGASDRQTEAAE
jgi:hypothetical protein